VEFFQGATLIATVLTPPYAYNWENVAAGSYQLTAKATDALGAETSIAPVTINVTNPQPSLVYLHADHLNTPRIATDETGKVIWRNLPTTEPFGNSPVEEDPDNDGIAFTLNLRFPGQYYDKEVNTHYNYFRDYDPSTGRYVQSDPIGLAGGLNTYSYVGGNPVWDFDNDGLMGSRGKVLTTPRFPGSSCGPEGSMYNFPNKFWGGANIEAACQAHDRCYENCSKSKRKCDSQFYSDIRQACLNLNDPVACNLASIAYFAAVSLGGDEPFKSARRQGCVCAAD
jgi:RHS repeat-associated protein